MFFSKENFLIAEIHSSKIVQVKLVHLIMNQVSVTEKVNLLQYAFEIIFALFEVWLAFNFILLNECVQTCQLWAALSFFLCMV